MPERVRDLMTALDRTLAEVRGHARATRDAISKHTFQPYYEYRHLIDQYEALAATIRGRLDKLPSDYRNHYADRLLKSERALLAVTIRGAFEALFALSAISTLPIGTKELFARELDALYLARDRLRSPDHVGQVPVDLEQDLEIAELILLEVMEKAPSLLSFDVKRQVAQPDTATLPVA